MSKPLRVIGQVASIAAMVLPPPFSTAAMVIATPATAPHQVIAKAARG